MIQVTFNPDTSTWDEQARRVFERLIQNIADVMDGPYTISYDSRLVRILG